MLCNLYCDENGGGRLGEAPTSPPSLRMAISHDFPIGKSPRGHPVLRIPERSSKGCLIFFKAIIGCLFVYVCFSHLWQ